MNSDESTPPQDPLPRPASVRDAAAVALALVRRANPRTRLLAGAAAGMVVLAVVLTVVFTSGSGQPGPDVAVDTGRTVPLLDEQPVELPSEDEPEPDDEKDHPLVDDKPRWTSSGVDVEDGSELLPVGDGYVVNGSDDTVSGLDGKGKRVWDREVDESDEKAIIGDSSVAFSRDDPDEDSWPGHKITDFVDPATGKKLWTNAEASFVELVGDAAYLSVCQGGQDGELGECVISAHDARTGAVRWSTPTYASTQVIDADPGGAFVVLQSHVTSGGDIRISVLDTGSGAVLGAGYDDGGSPLLAKDTLVRVGHDDNPADGCEVAVTAWNVYSGSQTWKREVGTPMEADGSDCNDLPDAYEGRIMGLNGKGRPVVVDLATGDVAWTAPKKADPVRATGKHALVTQGDKLVLYNTGKDKKRWAAPDVSGHDGPGFIGGYVVSSMYEGYDEEPCWARIGIKSGDIEAYPGQCAGSGDDWVATLDNGDIKLYAID
ncbi:PQQ-binding-like beta-propeller repeat protein [Stackebrandtia nassauensis]|uniref:Pyrrolo-quinoline quinone repeat domain-containing protein n=1 Tax=Stackebrandtia nassauensis (strain DSM 44728 / CIP 108903 / NRRL B-16338 / NBRC 102104 / LLR-40K-21) TaxID=446470 RepID=D3Q9M5_STANL|nr:PQQ-binding-like beta-propeller repeat protein [Stackebrandtia nassauensis]ADD44571.1 hypothetical protein Snas_4930 [Stackebrandtia nassauensis DSM 44728]